jgi:hypothetical protein
MTIDVYWKDWLSGKVIPAILGYATGIRGGGLHRVLPWAHPYIPVMFADGILSMQPIRFEGGNTKDSGNYRYARLNVSFSRRMYRVVPDGQVEEDLRYMVKYTRDTTDFINLERRFLMWAPNTPPTKWGNTSQPNSPGDNRGQPNTGIGPSVALRQPKTQLQWKWFQVPPEVMDINDRPVNIAALVGQVNQQPFAGYDSGTLLMLGPSCEPHVAPVARAGIDNDRVIYWDITVNMEYFNPQPLGGVMVNAVNGLALSQGHNVFPHPNGKWYPMVHPDANGGASTRTMYDPGDYTTIFRMVQRTS